MKKKDKTVQQKSSHVLKKYWAAIGLIVLFIVWLWLGIVNPRLVIQQDRKSLDVATSELLRIANKSAASQGTVKSDINSIRSCKRDSSKYNNGPIRCSLLAIFTVNSSTGFFESRSEIRNIIEQTGYFDIIRDGDFIKDSEQKVEGYTIRFSPKNDAGVSCEVWPHVFYDLNKSEYSFSCSKITSDFLPGYERVE